MALTLMALTLGLGCGGTGDPDGGGVEPEPVEPVIIPYLCPGLDASGDDAAQATLVGCVLDEAGEPVAGATVTRELLQTTTDERGVFVFTDDLLVSNALLEISADGHRDELLAHRAVQPGDSESSRGIPPVVLAPAVDGRTRFLFGGDVSFGRRFLDTDDRTPRGVLPPDDETALISVLDPIPGSLGVVSYIRRFYQDADIGVVNLESPVTDDLATPHLTKEYVYFTLPDSLNALIDLSIDYVSLGNNHIYDYLLPGLIDTLFTLDTLGMPHSGAGVDPEQAFAARDLEHGDTTYAMLSMNSIAGDEHEIEYVASATQGGAADLRDIDRVTEEIKTHAADGRVPIAQFHMGFEYTFEPTDGNVDRMKTAIDAGAALVVAHHTHVAQGFGMYNGALMAHCLGNLIFDQDRLETMLGVMLRVDMDREGSIDGQETTWANARAIPVYLEDYQPRPLSGDLAARFLRRLAEFSHGHGVRVIPYHGQGWIVPDSYPVVEERREVVLEVELSRAGRAILDLRQIAAADESLERIVPGRAGITARVGRDLMMHGDLEDWDVDDVSGEAARWDLGDASNTATLCAEPMRGRAALCSERRSDDALASRVVFRNRVRVMGESLGIPNKDVTLIAYGRGDNAGDVHAEVSYVASVDERDFGSESLPLFAAGSYDWTMVAIPLQLPEDDFDRDPRDPTAHARAVRLTLRHDGPPAGTGEVALDDIALVNWENGITDEKLSIPHARDFLLLRGPSGPATVTLTFTRVTPGRRAP